MSSLATKLNGYAAELCPPNVQKQISAKINDVMRKGWPILRELQMVFGVLTLDEYASADKLL